jgi:hypothetical protein
MIPSTVDRVPAHTSKATNERIRRQIEANVARVAAGGPGAIRRRLDELDREWDIERTLEANASTVSLIGLALAASRGRKWLVLPAAVASFLLLHAVQGWCPPIPILRRMGFRTASEIDTERYALKALRGDFSDVPTDTPSKRAVRQAIAASNGLHPRGG